MTERITKENNNKTLESYLLDLYPIFNAKMATHIINRGKDKDLKVKAEALFIEMMKVIELMK